MIASVRDAGMPVGVESHAAVSHRPAGHYDFYDLDDPLDVKLDDFFGAVADYDVDGDGRLRLHHPTEATGVGVSPDFIDYDEDEYVDDFDLFLAHFDDDGDRWVVYDTMKANAAGLGMLPEEFSDIDDQLARLIDEAHPDRDGDGIATTSDIELGYGDGVMDRRQPVTAR